MKVDDRCDRFSAVRHVASLMLHVDFEAARSFLLLAPRVTDAPLELTRRQQVCTMPSMRLWGRFGVERQPQYEITHELILVISPPYYHVGGKCWITH